MSPRPGPRRQPINARAADEDRAAIQRRADAEAGGNLSEMARRLLAYGLSRMPAGWTPENDPVRRV